MAAPTLRHNTIAGCKKAGVFFVDGGAGELLENDVHKNHVGVELKDDAEPVVKGNKIHHQKMGGVWVYKESKGTFEGNEIYANGKAAFRVYEWGDPTVTGNRIHGGKAGGLLVYARTQAACARLATAFATPGAVRKTYVALVAGRLESADQIEVCPPRRTGRHRIRDLAVVEGAAGHQDGHGRSGLQTVRTRGRRPSRRLRRPPPERAPGPGSGRPRR